MLLTGLLTLLSLMSVGLILLLMFKFTRGNRLKDRMEILEAYRSAPATTVGQKINELSGRFISSLGRYSRRNLLLEIAQEFKSEFNLGRFAIFELDQDKFIPIMSFGLNIKSIKPFRANFPDMDELRRGPVNRMKDRLGRPNNFDQTEAGNCARLANYPEDMNSLFIYFHKNESFGLLFLGEDPNKELAGYCLSDEFNKYIWPEIYNLYRHSHSLAKIQTKIRESEYRETKNRKSFGEAKKQNHTGTLNPQSMLNIANKLFSSSNENRLLEVYIDYLMSTLSIAKIAVFTSDSDKSFTVTQTGGKSDSPPKGAELLPDSQIYKLVMDRKTDAVVTLPGGGPRPENLSDALIFDHKFSLMSRIYLNERLAAIVFMGEHVGGQPYMESELVFLAGITNIANMAMDNIARYRLVEKLSYTDSMTELYNYRYFYKRLSEEIYRAKRFSRELALVIFDIDNFKSINDSYGHQAGDEILKKLSKLVLSSVRAIDVVSRYGGEEFCIIMPDTGHSSCGVFIERLRKMISENKFNNDQLANPYTITVSCGGAIYPADGQTADRLIYCADMALLEAKNAGRNRSLMYETEMFDRDITSDKSKANRNGPENENEV